jgi:hypothetical protein
MNFNRILENLDLQMKIESEKLSHALESFIREREDERRAR